ncbi:MAG: gluconokinase, GntK/IdnK-type [Hyphomonadaceae bacterium]
MLERRIILVMGPAGSGKSTVAEHLSHETNWPMIEADDHHPEANRKKMASGNPLTDQDRAAWIDSLAKACRDHSSNSIVLACSALTPYVQTRLLNEVKRSIIWVLLEVPADVLQARLEARTDHFMPASQLQDQLAALKAPEGALLIDADRSVAEITDSIRSALEDQT